MNKELKKWSMKKIYLVLLLYIFVMSFGLMTTKFILHLSYHEFQIFAGPTIILVGIPFYFFLRSRSSKKLWP